MCEFDSCKNFASGKRLCGSHKYQLEKYGEMFPIGYLARRSLPEPMPECSISHCSNSAQSRADGAMCEPHYQKKYRGFDPESYVIRGDGERSDVKCLVEDCAKRARSASSGVCAQHRESIAMGRIECPDGALVELNPMCSFHECPKRASSRRGIDLCHGHYVMQLDGRDLAPLNDGKYSRGELPCRVHECESPAQRKGGICATHHSRFMNYDLTLDEFLLLMKVGVCQNEGCNNTTNLHVDHDHATGKVRDILCSGCNTSLGFLGESIERLEGLISYIKKHSSVA